MMLRPVSTLRIGQDSVSNLIKHGYIFLEDIIQNPESRKFLTEKEFNIINCVPKAVESIDLFTRCKAEIMIPCESLNRILDGGFECGTMTELCGAPGSGKSQICFQVSVAVQLDKIYGGLNGKVVYIDTRNGFSPLRVMGKTLQIIFNN